LGALGALGNLASTTGFTSFASFTCFALSLAVAFSVSFDVLAAPWLFAFAVIFDVVAVFSFGTAGAGSEPALSLAMAVLSALSPDPCLLADWVLGSALAFGLTAFAVALVAVGFADVLA